jgi:S-disulfanyl-L-cysteine oxidoreductase SoxD
MRLTPWGSVLIRHATGGAVCIWLLAGAFTFTSGSLAAQAKADGQQSLSDGVYSSAQAIRGQQIYQAQCAECHGNAMEGTSGPPLAGAAFLSKWSARSLLDLVDKIQKTMPFTASGTLSRQQSIDLASYTLQRDTFPAGSVDLNEAVLSRIAFPAAASAVAAAPSGTASLPPPEGNLAELMRAIAFPNSNIIFNLQLKDPGAQAKKKDQAAAPFDYVEWGSTVYPGWLAVDQAAVALTETAPLLLTPGRLCQNGKPVPVDRQDWKQFVAALVDAGKLARRASQARDFPAFTTISEKLNDACANCHKVYRDKGGAEGSGASRCQ